MKIWVDDVRPAPEGYEWHKSVSDVQSIIEYTEILKNNAIIHGFGWSTEEDIELIDLDHDAGDYASDGGDYIRILDWLEETGRNYPIRIHSQNPVGVQNMRRIIERNGWKEIR